MSTLVQQRNEERPQVRARALEAATLVPRALAGDSEAVETLVDRLMPVVRARVRRALAKRGRSLGPNDGDDLVQEIWLVLIAHEGRQLLAFDPERGMTLEGYVGLVAEREVGNLIDRERAKKRGGHLRAVELDEAESAAMAASPEEGAIAANLAAKLGEHIQNAMPARGQLVFRHAFTDGREPPEVAKLMGVSVQVVYNWQHKIRELARTFLKQ